MINLRFYLDKDKEQNWLNRMSQDGWAFTNFFFCIYMFSSCSPGKYNYQIDLIDTWNGEDTDYISFLEDTGVHIITQWFRWIYLSRLSSEGPFELYTDCESKLQHYRRIKKFFCSILLLEAICVLFLTLTVVIHEQDLDFLPFTFMIVLFCLFLLRIVLKLSKKIRQIKEFGR